MSSEESATCLHSVAHTAGWESGFPRIDESSSDFPKIGQKETSSVKFLPCFFASFCISDGMYKNWEFMHKTNRPWKIRGESSSLVEGLSSELRR